MKSFFKWLAIFLFSIVVIVLANMAYDYIKVCYWGNAIEQTLDEIK